ncbi:ImmA/IrrE family metallo-endopeptidase [Pseudovibrio sp. POLY-S9]|uniref:ImmA/IrrE family metallo-endopeptidase n=1 Tax=Pseudovibrio sp. POLY-S9 TaxID=1576596 RepID=UPI00070E0923|nr:ImmA/IrrE family metallo-endopeptidase [Pseudovibrio sp. POLY-S9]
MTSSVEKGDKLEDDFYRYLLDQKDKRELVYGLNHPELCEIFKKKSYPCSDRGEDVEFDVVIELRGEGRVEPHMYIVFECKNYKSSVPELYVRDFSDKLSTVFGHSAKGILVSSSRLQSGAEKIARKRKMGIAKYDKHGIEIVADRKGRSWTDKSYLKSQIFKDARHTKSLKFSAYHDGKYFSSFSQLLSFLDSDQEVDGDHVIANSGISVPYLSDEAIKASTKAVLERCEHVGGAVDLAKICERLSIDLSLTERNIRDETGSPILGSANFDRKTIEINFHENERQKRFTIGHELGHFCLDHGRFLRSESIIANDLLLDKVSDDSFRYERLEFQANKFAAELLLPESEFKTKTEELRRHIDIRDRGHGYIYVDDQPTNLRDYLLLLSGLEAYFEVSKSAIEIRFKKLGMLADRRTNPESTRISSYLTSNGCDA